MKSVAVTVATTPTLILAKDDKPRHVYLHVVGTAAVYLGDSTVTTSTGLLTEKHTSPIEFFVPTNEQIYGVVSTGTESIRVLTPDVD